MKQVTLNIPDKKLPFFMELIKNLGLTEETGSNNEPTKAQILNGIKESVKEVNLIKKGKLKGIPAKDLLNEL
jgi:hypothetical protein